MSLYSAPLASTAAVLRQGTLKIDTNLANALHRLNYVDSHLRAFVLEPHRRDRVFAAAHRLKEQYADPAERPLLYGVLVGIKDIFRVDDLSTRAGSDLPAELLDAPEADCVARLKAQGAIVLGKTVTTEFAYFEPGPTRNPHNLAHTPGGSSSGSAAAVAAGLVPLALGTQTVGSVIRPAAYCGIVGFKPSYGRIDPAGVIYVASSLDHVGLFTQDVEGMALAASILCRDWQAVSESNTLPVLGIPVGPYLDQATAEGLAAFEVQVQQLQAAGYRVERVDMLADISEIALRHWDVMAYEMARQHEAWFAQHESSYRPRTVELIRRGQDTPEIAVAAGQVSQANLRESLARLMQNTGVELWISPPAPGPAPEGIDSTGDPAMNLAWTHAGLPTITVPAGQAENGLPLGLQCSGVFGADEQVITWAGNLCRVFNDSAG